MMPATSCSTPWGSLGAKPPATELVPKNSGHKKRTPISRKSLIYLVELSGIEPLTSTLCGLGIALQPKTYLKFRGLLCPCGPSSLVASTMMVITSIIAIITVFPVVPFPLVFCSFSIPFSFFRSLLATDISIM
jgi:hypothetical protein